MIPYEKLSNLQTQENPLGVREWFYDRQEGLLLHRMRLFGLYLPSQAQPPESAVSSRSRFEITRLVSRDAPNPLRGDGLALARG